MNVNTKNFFINGTVTVAVNLIIRAAAVALNAYISSSIGSNATGLLTLVMSIYSFAVTLATSGINLAVTRTVAEALGCLDGKKAAKSIRAAAFYSLFFGLLSTALLYFGSDIIASLWIGDVRGAMPLRILSFSLLPCSLGSAISGYFTAVRKVTQSASTMTFGQLVRILSTLFLLSRAVSFGTEYAVSAVVAGMTVAETVTVIIMVILYLFDRKKENFETADEDRKGVSRYLLSITLPIAFSSYLRSALVTVEHILIPKGLSKGGADREYALSSYGTLHGMALPLVLFPGAIPGAFAGLIVPEVAERHVKGDSSAVRRVSEKVIKVTLLFSVSCAVLLFAFADVLSVLVYKNESVAVFIRYFAPLVPVMYLDSSVDAILKGMGEQFASMKINIIDAAFSVAAVYFLVPKFGLYGYIATVYLSETLNFALSLRRLTEVADFRVDLFRWIILPSLISILSAYFSRSLFSTILSSPDIIALLPLVLSVILSVPTMLLLSEKKKRRNGNAVAAFRNRNYSA